MRKYGQSKIFMNDSFSPRFVVFLVIFVIATAGLSFSCSKPQSVTLPVEVIVKAKHLDGVKAGDLEVILKNNSKENLVFDSRNLPWSFNGSGLSFMLYRESGSVIPKIQTVADPALLPATTIRFGELRKQDVSLYWYYDQLDEELTAGEVIVRWEYKPQPNNYPITNVLSGQITIRKKG